jgi:hypothetical protein
LTATSIVFQSARLGDIGKLLEEFAWAEKLLPTMPDDIRIYGISGGALAALAMALTISAQKDTVIWGRAEHSMAKFANFLQSANSRSLRAFNRNPWYGIYHLGPIKKWVGKQIKAACEKENPNLSEFSVPLYLCAMDRDGVFTLFGPPNDSLQFQYQQVRVGPPQDAPVLDALEAALSSLLSTSPVMVRGAWFRDCYPAYTDGGAVISDLEAASGEERKITRDQPYAPIRTWKLNWITSSFVMHSQNSRNQSWLACYYLDLANRQRALEIEFNRLREECEKIKPPFPCQEKALGVLSPVVGHVDLPYVGSTEAYTNMRQSVEQKDQLIAKFSGLLQGQLDGFPFDQEANLIYGAGGFSGILAGLTTTRLIDDVFARQGGAIRQVLGVSAGVLNGFFHAIQLAARRHPDLYKPPAAYALDDLEKFISHVSAGKIVKFNYNPIVFWQGWANLGPLEKFLLERLSAYTGSTHPEQITFEDIALPMTVAAGRRDGFNDYFGMTTPDRRMRFGGREITVSRGPVVRAIIAGWSMNTYINPTKIGDQLYTDGGGPFYDNGLFTCCMDPSLINLLNVHLDEPEGHSYNLPPRPNLLRILFDTHNYYFPEERRRMRLLTDLLYKHYRLRAQFTAARALLPEESAASFVLPADFRRDWEIHGSYANLLSSVHDQLPFLEPA